MYFLLVVSTSVVICLERSISELTDNVSSETLNSAHLFFVIPVIWLTSIWHQCVLY